MKLPIVRDISASQYKLATACLARWGSVYLEGGQREPDSDATRGGKAVHAELEAWVLRGTLPKSKTALLGLPHAPAPGQAHVERKVNFSTDSDIDSRWLGFIDVQYAVGPNPLELDGAAEIVIQDWKTTSNIKNALTVEELLDDPQANIYVYEAYRHQRAKAVRGKWVYLPTKGGNAVPIEASFDRNKVLDYVEGTLDPVAGHLQQLYREQPKWHELPKNPGHCFAWGRKCPKYDECPKPASMTMPTEPHQHGEQPMSDAFKDFLSTFPALPPGVPASVPPPPPPVAVAPPVPEAGFVNPPEAPKVAAESPEHAAVLQGIVAPPPPPADDLDGLSRDQLKALAVMSGAEPENTRKREAALRDAIRLHRAQNGTERSASCGTAPPPPRSTPP